MTAAAGAGCNQTDAGLATMYSAGLGYLIGYPTKPGYRSRPKGSEDIIDDLLLLSRGQLDRLVSACRLAVTDWRDLKVAADLIRNPAAQPSITTVVEPERPKVSGS
jgi:hypothetical protein